MPIDGDFDVEGVATSRVTPITKYKFRYAPLQNTDPDITDPDIYENMYNKDFTFDVGFIFRRKNLILNMTDFKDTLYSSLQFNIGDIIRFFKGNTIFFGLESDYPKYPDFKKADTDGNELLLGTYITDNQTDVTPTQRKVVFNDAITHLLTVNEFQPVSIKGNTTLAEFAFLYNQPMKEELLVCKATTPGTVGNTYTNLSNMTLYFIFETNENCSFVYKGKTIEVQKLAASSGSEDSDDFYKVFVDKIEIVIKDNNKVGDLVTYEFSEGIWATESTESVDILFGSAIFNVKTKHKTKKEQLLFNEKTLLLNISQNDVNLNETEQKDVLEDTLKQLSTATGDSYFLITSKFSTPDVPTPDVESAVSRTSVLSTIIKYKLNIVEKPENMKIGTYKVFKYVLDTTYFQHEDNSDLKIMVEYIQDGGLHITQINGVDSLLTFTPITKPIEIYGDTINLYKIGDTINLICYPTVDGLDEMRREADMTMSLPLGTDIDDVDTAMVTNNFILNVDDIDAAAIGSDPVISPFFGSGFKVKLPDLPGHVYRLLQGGGVTINAEIMACPVDKVAFLQTRHSLFFDQKIIEGTYIGKVFVDVTDLSFRHIIDLSQGIRCVECVLPDGSSWDGAITDGEVKPGVDPDYKGKYMQRILSVGGGVMKLVVRIYDHPQVQNEFRVLRCNIDPSVHDGLLMRNYKPKLFFLNDLCDTRILTKHKKNKNPLTFRHPVVKNQVTMKCA